MWIENTGGIAYRNPDSEPFTFAMTNPSGTVTVEQMGVDKDDWFEYKDNGESANLDADNTARSIFAPIKLRITAVGTGVRLYNRKNQAYKPAVIKK